MSRKNRVRTTVRRSALLALVTTSAATTSLTAGVSPASAHTPGSWEINNYRHFAGLTQETGSDEFYLLTVNFQFQLGRASSLVVTKNSPYEIDDIDDEEYHSVAARMGQSRFDLDRGWAPEDMITANVGPWMFGSVTVMMESDTSPWSSINAVHNAATTAIRNKLAQYVGSASPRNIALNLAAQAGIDFISPSNRDLRDAVLKDWAAGVAATTLVDALGRVSLWQGVTALADDIIGAPHVSAVVGLENYKFLGLIPFNLGTQFNSAMASKGLFGPSGDQVMALPTFTKREYTQQYKGDGARYVMNVRADRLS